MDPHIQGVMLVLCSACLLAVSMNIAKAVIPRLPLYLLLAARSFGALVLLVPLTIVLGRQESQSPSLFFLVAFALGGLVWPGLVNVLAYKALRVLPVNVNRPIFQTYPAVAFVLSIPLALGTFSFVKLAGVLLATAGASGFALFNRDASNPGKKLPRLAIAMVAISAVIQAVGHLIWRWVRTENIIPPCEMNMLQHIPALVFFGVLTFATWRLEPPERRAFSKKDLLLAAFSGMLLFGVGNTLYFVALKHLDPGPAGAVYSVNILLTAALARFTLKERWTRAQALSAALVLAGVALLSLHGDTRNAPRPGTPAPAPPAASASP
ncbi:MAG: DMT family transporter [Planctomycetes bacterium]|nr:DMT family transporter [Planctomycetota bacterium]